MSLSCELTGKAVQAGNNVRHAYNKTRRRFMPNLQARAILSDALGRSVRLKVSAAGLRTLEKKGGLDAYLLSADDAVLSVNARRLKRRIEKAQGAVPSK